MGLLNDIKEAKKMALEMARIRNKPNPDCIDKCKNAEKSLLFIANNLNDEIDVTQITIICNKCGQSTWQIMNRKETKK